MSHLSVSRRAARYATGPLAILVLLISTMWGQADVQGQWSVLTYSMTINPIHVILMHNGDILVTTGSGNCPASQAGCPAGPPYGANNHSGAVVLDPIAQTITQLSVDYDMMCNSMTALPDGRVLIVGGTLAYDPFRGSAQSSVFDPSTNSFTDQQNMAHGRWYPTAITLGDGRVMVFSGYNDSTGSTNTAVEFYSVGVGWSQEYVATWSPPLYPRLHLLPDGSVFASASQPNSQLFNPSTTAWNLNIATTNYGGTRTYGSSVLLPLMPAKHYDPVIMILGGDNPATATTELIDLGSSLPAWQPGPNMSQPRTEMDAVILPTGKVLAVGGSSSDENASTASLNADLYDPVSSSFSSAGANTFPRMYHSVALLLPDATVWLAGSNPVRGTYESHMEVYQPPYLFARDANNNVIAATRPTISGVPNQIAWNGSFTVFTPDAANISQVVLVRPGSSSHSFDFEQRLVDLDFSAGSGTLAVTAPPDGNVAPPGYYMLFLINNQGVPSVSNFVLLAGLTPAPAPTVTSVSPNTGPAGGGTNATITGANFTSGATVSFGGTAATSNTVVSSTSITATPAAHAVGSVYVTVTNNDGQSGTLSNGYAYVLPADFTITASAFSPPDVAAGALAISTIAITPVSGFAGVVNLTCSVAPVVTPAPTCTLASNSIGSGSGATMLTVGTEASTLAFRLRKTPLFAMWLPITGLALLRVGFGSRTKKILAFLFGCTAFSGLILLASCGGSLSQSRDSGHPGTPPGAYIITLTGTSGSLSHSAAVSLTVH